MVYVWNIVFLAGRIYSQTVTRTLNIQTNSYLVR